MTRSSWIYPRDGSDPVPKDQYYVSERAPGTAILPDLPDFVSPIDRKLYSGRAGLREHCRKHDVVPNLDLKGLPNLAYDSDTRSRDDVRRDNAARKEQIIKLVNNYR